MGLTRRCPLHCAHCSTSSTMDSEQLPSHCYTRFVDTFTRESHPTLLALSGGEALLRPRLVEQLALAAKQVGTYTSVLSGMFFAQGGHIPKPIARALAAVDHFSASIDQFHELEVPRESVFAVLSILLDDGKNLSIHIAGTHADDPYIDDIVHAIQRCFGQRIPMVVNTLSRFGRGRELIPQSPWVPWDGTPEPCTVAAWPVITFNGDVVACGNDNLSGQVPEHLLLGHIQDSNWSDIANACRKRHTLRALRTVGPQWLAKRYQHLRKQVPVFTEQSAAACQACITLADHGELDQQVGRWMDNMQHVNLEQEIIELQTQLGASAFAKRYTHPRYADLVMLGQ